MPPKAGLFCRKSIQHLLDHPQWCSLLEKQLIHVILVQFMVHTSVESVKQGDFWNTSCKVAVSCNQHVLAASTTPLPRSTFSSLGSDMRWDAHVL
jgi:hypothetical protein